MALLRPASAPQLFVYAHPLTEMPKAFVARLEDLMARHLTFDIVWKYVCGYVTASAKILHCMYYCILGLGIDLTPVSPFLVPGVAPATSACFRDGGVLVINHNINLKVK